MAKLLRLSVITLALAALCVPSAAYQVNWSTGFEPPTYGAAPLAGQNGWTLLSGTSPNVVTAPSPVRTGAQSAEQAVGTSMAGKNLTYLAPFGLVYESGWAKFWMYDPGDVPDGAGGFLQTDGRVGIQSSVGGSSASTVWSANVTTSKSTTYWTGQWSWSPVVMDGVTPGPSAPGYTFTQGIAALRVPQTWSYVMLAWSFTYDLPNDPGSGGSGVVKWYVNQTTSPNLRLDFNDQTTRWANSHDVAGVVLNSSYACVTPCAVDDIEFHSPIPEPSSLLALGAGLTGLAGLIRRRRKG